MRISNSIVRTQRIIFSEQFTERIEVLAEKMLVEPFEFDFDGDEEDEDEEGDEDFEEEEDFEPEVGDDFEEQEGDEENGNK